MRLTTGKSQALSSSRIFSRKSWTTANYLRYLLVLSFLISTLQLSVAGSLAHRQTRIVPASGHNLISVVQGGQVFERSGNLKADVLDWAAQEFLPRDQNLYRIPTQNDLNTWRQVIDAMLNGQLTTAASLAQGIAPSYKVIKFTDTSANPPRLYHLLLEADVTVDDIFPFASTGWGVYVFDPSPVRDIAISIPHIKADLNTELEGNEALINLRARCLLLFTSHRCASNTVSPCNGSATSCSDGRLHVSDASHGASPSAPSVTNTFQVAHEELVKLKPSTIVLQFHGNIDPPCSQVTLSNGGSNFQIIPDGNVSRLKQSLVALSFNVKVCDHTPGAGECDLCGTTNLQARYINGSATNPCQTPAPSPTGVERFIHIEQASTVRQDALLRQRIIQAIANTTFVRPPDSGWVCQDNWRVTGYFTPIEAEYSGPLQSVFIEGVGNDSFKSDFLSEVSTEGWGKTRYGWYLGYYSSTWHKSNAPLDANGNSLVVGTVAVDPTVISFGSQVKTPTLPSPWNTMILTASDSGVQGKHIDVYCGEGSAAKQETFRITGVDGFNKQVCVKSLSGGSQRRRIIVGYWQNFDNGSRFIKLRDVSGNFDVINVAFAVPAPGTASIQFTPDPAHTSVNEVKSDIAILKSRGKKVLISIGGANGAVQLNTATDKQNFITSVTSIINQYGFDGMDIDFETSSLILNSGDNDFRSPTTPRITNLISAIRTIADNFGPNFVLSMAPETFFVQGGYVAYGPGQGAYLPVIHALRDKLTYIHVQHYNTGSMKALDDSIYSSSNADFHVAMAEMLLQGFNVPREQNKFFPPLREDQVAIGLPASPSAASSGFTTVAEVQKALDYLIRGRSFGGSYILRKPEGYPGFKGLMTWSINWDAANSFQFSTSHRAYLDSLP